RRLLDRGIAVEQLGEMTCPIGVTGIVDKAPSSIAVAVAAQLMQMRVAQRPAEVRTVAFERA
ncbi:MAG TPA: xanthine dehydrogenase accessory protein XdhC, partial [Paraburkholderia sp.]